jgi:hypothetical protein
MKSKKISSISILILGFAVLYFTACKKDRVPQDDYQSMDSFYTDNEEEEQEYTIDSTGSTCLIAKKGTRICITADMLEFSGGGSVTYPFQLKVIELYSIKDMLLRRYPSVAGSQLLQTSAEIRIRAFKNGTEVQLKPGRAYLMETASLPSIVTGMQSYYGFDNGGTNDWTSSIASIIPGFVDTLSSVTPTSNTYILTPAKTGWVSAAKPYNGSGGNATLSLTVPGTNTQNIQVYISFTGFKGIMRITNLTSLPIPVGEQFKMVAFGKKQNNNFVLEQQTITLSGSQTIPLNMQTVSQSNLLTALGGL